MNSTNFDIFTTSDNTHSVIKLINIPIKTTRGSVKLGSTIVDESGLSILVIHHQHVYM